MFVYGTLGENTIRSSCEEWQEVVQEMKPITEEPARKQRGKDKKPRKSRVKNIFTQDTLVDRKWIADLVEVSEGLIGKWENNPEMHFPKRKTKNGNAVLYCKKAVIIWLAETLRQPQLDLR